MTFYNTVLDSIFMRNIWLLFFLCSCGTRVDPSLQPYFDRFEKQIRASSSGISGEFVSLDAPTLGRCHITENSRTIQIDPNAWNSMNDFTKEQLIFHELGHCSLLLQHINSLGFNGCPISIMISYSFGNSICYQNNREYYFGELRSHIISIGH